MLDENKTPTRRAMERHFECRQFYNQEAELLDAKDFEGWLELLTEDVDYQMPVRVTREAGTERSEFSDEAFNYRETRSTLEARVERFQSEYAWSVDPPSRTRHFITNVRVNTEGIEASGRSVDRSDSSDVNDCESEVNDLSDEHDDGDDSDGDARNQGDRAPTEGTNGRARTVETDEFETKTNLLLFRGQGDETGIVLSAERHDVLRRVDGELKLAARDIYLDHTVIPMKNLPVFF